MFSNKAEIVVTYNEGSIVFLRKLIMDPLFPFNGRLSESGVFLIKK